MKRKIAILVFSIMNVFLCQVHFVVKSHKFVILSTHRSIHARIKRITVKRSSSGLDGWQRVDGWCESTEVGPRTRLGVAGANGYGR